MKSTAIILSAGKGKRMQSTTAKQYLEINNKPILYYSLKTFADSPVIDNIIIVIGSSDYDFVKTDIVSKYQIPKVSDIITGGKERYHSVYNGLNAPAAANSDVIFIHDGARPLISGDIILKAAEEIENHPAIVVGTPVKDTIKRIDKANIVCETPERKSLWSIQTPQVFAAPLIKEAYRTLIEKEHELPGLGVEITDDAMVIETFTKIKVKLIKGNDQNIKITTPADLKAAEAYM